MADDTGPDTAIPIARQPNGRSLTLKDLATLVTVITIMMGAVLFIFGLMFFGKSAGEALRSDHDHHVESAKPKLEKVDSLDKALYRIEVRQRMMAPKRVRDKMPSLPEPERDEPGP